MATAGSAAVVIAMIWAAGALLGSSTTVQGASDDHPNAAPLATLSPSNPPPTGRLSQAGSPSSSSSRPTTPQPTTPLPPPTSSTPPPPPPPPPPGPCPDAVTQVTATVGAASYPVGGRPVFTLHITNTGPVPCIRDVSHQFRTLAVVPAAGGNTLWSSSDCYSLVTHEIPVLPPGQGVSYSVDWAGRTSAPGCRSGRTNVPAGEYAVIGKLDGLTSPPIPFALTSN